MRNSNIELLRIGLIRELIRTPSLFLKTQLDACG